MEHITLKLLQYQNLIKIYHWQTKSYARHKASDELFDSLNNHIDKFIEIIQGSRNKRIHFNKVQNIPINNVSDNGATKLLTNFRTYLNNDLQLNTDDTDLLALRDEIVMDINKTLYLFMFN